MLAKNKLTIILIFIAIVILMSGCKILVDEDDPHSYPQEGILKIVNDTEYNVWISVEGAPEYNLEPGEYVEHAWNLLEGEAIQAELEYYLAGGNPVLTTVTVEAGYITTFTIDYESGGIHMQNNSSFEIWYQLDGGALHYLDPGEYEVITYELLHGETIWVDLEYAIIGSEPVFTTVGVEAGYVTVFTVEQVNGELQISNESSRDVWYDLDGGADKTLHAGEVDEWSYDLLVYDQTTTDISYSGYHVFSNSSFQTITGGYTTFFDIEADGGGINIENDMNYTDITAIYLSPSSDPNWGVDDLYGTLSPGEDVFWTVSPGSWDILAIDEDGAEYISYDNTIYLDQTRSFFIDGWKKSDGKNTDMKSKEYYPDVKTKDRVELKSPVDINQK
ncbi:MAG: hypothetical protein KGY74_06340 [Candidatus Cloacimonetes bacterium]|nr:hypothetical protein [Candidatus Cloacimonadota bacterium]